MPNSESTSPTKASHRPGDDHQKTKPNRRGRPAGDREGKRAELLAAAISVIAREGYAGASMRKVAKQAGCTTGAVTYYFENKEDIVSAVAQNVFDQFDTMLDAGTELVDVRTIIKQWLDWTSLSETDTWLAVFQLLAHARHEPAFASIIQQRYARFRQQLTEVLIRGQTQGVVRDDIPADLLADQLTAISDGWMMMHPIEPERFAPSRADAILDSLIAMISPLSKSAG